MHHLHACIRCMHDVLLSKYASIHLAFHVTILLRAVGYGTHDCSFYVGMLQVIYLDTDTLWVDDPIWWWTHFAHMSTLNAAFGMAEEAAEEMQTSWYTNGE